MCCCRLVAMVNDTVDQANPLRGSPALSAQSHQLFESRLLLLLASSQYSTP